MERVFFDYKRLMKSMIIYLYSKSHTMERVLFDYKPLIIHDHNEKSIFSLL